MDAFLNVVITTLITIAFAVAGFGAYLIATYEEPPAPRPIVISDRCYVVNTMYVDDGSGDDSPRC